MERAEVRESDARVGSLLASRIHIGLSLGIFLVAAMIFAERWARGESGETVRVEHIEKEVPMTLTRCWISGDDRVVVTTQQGVNPPGAPLVPEDGGDLSSETLAQVRARHAARVAATLVEFPKTGDCE